MVIKGLRVAFLSGKYSSEARDTSGPAYAERAVQDLVEKVGGLPIDLLLVSEWVEDSPPLMEALGQGQIEPRYIVCGNRNLFRQLAPYQTVVSGHACRMICLGKVGEKDKDKKWLHGLTLDPVTNMSSEVLLAKPDDLVPCYFSKKRKREDGEVGQGRELFIRNMPNKASEEEAKEGLRRFYKGVSGKSQKCIRIRKSQIVHKHTSTVPLSSSLIIIVLGFTYFLSK